jgi:hypothetical protein
MSLGRSLLRLGLLIVVAALLAAPIGCSRSGVQVPPLASAR